MNQPRDLRARLALGLLGYALLLGALVGGIGLLMFETVEREAWRALLEVEMARVIALRQAAPEFAFSPTDSLSLAVTPISASASGSGVFAGLGPGLHHALVDGERRLAVLVRDQGEDRLYLSFDITELERRERTLGLLVAGLALVAALALGLLGWQLAGTLLAPLRRLAAEVAAIDPRSDARPLPELRSGGPEIALIRAAINGYIERQASHLRREREFVDSAGHELRTPIAVISGAAELALGHRGLPESVRRQLRRILLSARGAEQLANVLLVLAKDPSRLAESADRIHLDEVLLDIIDDHRHLCPQGALELRVETLAPCEILAPIGVLQVAVGNLLRNALEHSHRGVVRVGLDPPGVFWVEDPGSDLRPEDIARIYASRAREGAQSSGIGLPLVRRIAEHLGWRIEFASSGGGGTRALLDLRASLIDGARGRCSDGFPT